MKKNKPRQKRTPIKERLAQASETAKLNERAKTVARLRAFGLSPNFIAGIMQLKPEDIKELERRGTDIIRAEKEWAFLSDLSAIEVGINPHPEKTATLEARHPEGILSYSGYFSSPIDRAFAFIKDQIKEEIRKNKQKNEMEKTIALMKEIGVDVKMRLSTPFGDIVFFRYPKT